GAGFKLKRPLARLDVVVTAVERGHGRRRGVLSDYTFAVRAAADDPRLLVVGKAYSGLTDAEIAALTTRFESLTVERRGGWHRVRPEVVLEVTFDVVQPSSRHTSGYALRFPRIVRVRDDKPVEDIDTLERVRELAGAGRRAGTCAAGRASVGRRWGRRSSATRTGTTSPWWPSIASGRRRRPPGSSCRTSEPACGSSTSDAARARSRSDS